MEIESADWNVLRTRSRQENVVERALLQKQIPVFIPRISKARPEVDHSKQTLGPLFPGYAFVKPAPEQFYSLRFIPGSCGLLMGRNGPGVILQKELDSIRILVKTNPPIDKHSELIPGTRVRVMMGPLSGLEGELVRLRNQQRLVLNTKILGQAISVEININEVCKVEPSRPE